MPTFTAISRLLHLVCSRELEGIFHVNEWRAKVSNFAVGVAALLAAPRGPSRFRIEGRSKQRPYASESANGCYCASRFRRFTIW